QLAALLRPCRAASGENPHRAGRGIVARTAHHGRIAVGRQRHTAALLTVAHSAAADKFAALLRPGAAAAGEDPGSASIAIVLVSASNQRIAVGRQRDRKAQVGSADRAGAGQLGALLGPYAAAAGEDPDRAGLAVVVMADDRRGGAVGRQRDENALAGGAHAAAADQSAALLCPRPGAGAGENPGRA